MDRLCENMGLLRHSLVARAACSRGTAWPGCVGDRATASYGLAGYCWSLLASSPICSDDSSSSLGEPATGLHASSAVGCCVGRC